MTDKASLIDTFRHHVEATLADLERARAGARDGMRVDGSHRPSNRGERAAVTSQGYLTAALEARMAEARSTLDLLDRLDPAPREKVVTGALVLVDDGEEEARYLLLPGGQGLELPGGVRVLSPDSPLGQALWGLEEGDAATVRRAGVEAEVEVLEVG